MRDEYKRDLELIQENLAGYLTDKAAEYSAVAPVWSENEEGVWYRSGRMTAFDPDTWDEYIDGTAVGY